MCVRVCTRLRACCTLHTHTYAYTSLRCAISNLVVAVIKATSFTLSLISEPRARKRNRAEIMLFVSLYIITLLHLVTCSNYVDIAFIFYGIHFEKFSLRICLRRDVRFLLCPRVLPTRPPIKIKRLSSLHIYNDILFKTTPIRTVTARTLDKSRLTCEQSRARGHTFDRNQIYWRRRVPQFFVD